MKLYLSRALKYILRMTVILGIIFAVMVATNTFDAKGMTVFRAIFMTWRGAVIILLLLALAFLYPKISFMTANIHANMKDNRENLINTFALYGYSLASEDEGGMTFRVNSKLKRLLWQFDDRVRITQDGSFMDIEGLKKVVLRAETRLHSILKK